VDADRFSAYRLGGFLPLVSEFPLSLPGYYFQKSAHSSSCCSTPTTSCRSTPENFSTWIERVHGRRGLSARRIAAGNSLSGVGGGILYHTPSNRLKLMLNYAYGIDAIRSNGRGASSIGVLMQIDSAG